jgi:hypothetical protein
MPGIDLLLVLIPNPMVTIPITTRILSSVSITGIGQEILPDIFLFLFSRIGFVCWRFQMRTPC